MQLERLEETIRNLRFRGPVRVQEVAGDEPVKIWLTVGDDADADAESVRRGQRVEISHRAPHLLVRSKVCNRAELGEGADLLWTLSENATNGLGAVVVRGAYVWVEMALLADHVDEPELALAIEAVGLEADQLEAKATEGGDRF